MIQRMIKNIDPYAFISLTDASSVWGCGFDPMRVSSDSKSSANKRILVFASNSSHKLAEARAIFGDKYDIRSLADIGCYIDIPESAGSIQGNAMLKARFVKRYYGFDCVADDTALECTSLNGLPGIYSRNYAAINDQDITNDMAARQNMEEWNDNVSQEMLNILHNHKPVVEKPIDYNVKANTDKLLHNLEGKTDRSAKIHTVLAFITGDFDDHTQWQINTFEGILSGTIALKPADDNDNSFFYDSVFIPDGFDKTYHELGFDVKNHISQRAIAISKLKAFLENKKQ